MRQSKLTKSARQYHAEGVMRTQVLPLREGFVFV
jgi:hypothetical protein